MPIIQHFKSTNIWKAFILNSITATLVITIAITVKDQFDTYTSSDSIEDQNIKRHTNVKSILLTLLFTFLASLFAYTIMYFLFGFGGGMLTNS